MPVELEQKWPAKYDEAKVAQNVNLLPSTKMSFVARRKSSRISSVIVNRFPCLCLRQHGGDADSSVR